MEAQLGGLWVFLWGDLISWTHFLKWRNLQINVPGDSKAEVKLPSNVKKALERLVQFCGSVKEIKGCEGCREGCRNLGFLMNLAEFGYWADWEQQHVLSCLSSAEGMVFVQFMGHTCSCVHLNICKERQRFGPSRVLLVPRSCQEVALCICTPCLPLCLWNYAAHVFPGKCFPCLCPEEVYVRRTRKRWAQ